MSRIYKEYDLIQQIDTGSFSAIYKAKRKSDGLIVAIKILEAQNQNEINLIETEAKSYQGWSSFYPSYLRLFQRRFNIFYNYGLS